MSSDSLEFSDQRLIRERLRAIRAENAEQRAKEQGSFNEVLQQKLEKVAQATKSDSSLSQQIFRPLRTGWYEVIQEFDLLSREDQERLGRAVEAGQSAEIRLNEEVGIGIEQRSRLEAFVREGLEAQEIFVLHNLRLVRSFAFYYSKKVPRIDLDDVFQAGVIGLMRAAQKFDWRRGYTFSTYATWWIRQSMSREWQNTGPIIHVPVHVWSDLAAPKDDGDSWTTKDGLVETSDRVVAKEALNGLTSFEGAPDHVQDDWVCAEQRMLGKQTYLVEEMDDFDSIWSALHLLMGLLDDRTREMYILYYGMDLGNPRTLEEVGDLFNLTRERVRQLLEEGMSIMRHAASVNLPENGKQRKRQRKRTKPLEFDQFLVDLSSDEIEQLRWTAQF